MFIGMLAALPVAADSPAIGAAPPSGAEPRVEFAFEERVTISPAAVLAACSALGWKHRKARTSG